ncbi:hypothetical protein STEG23_001430 [Scotinomys teguina]
MASSEPCYSTTASPEYSNKAEAQENDFKTNLKKMLEALNEEMNESPKEIQKNTNNSLIPTGEAQMSLHDIFMHAETVARFGAAPFVNTASSSPNILVTPMTPYFFTASS